MRKLPTLLRRQSIDPASLASLVQKSKEHARYHPPSLSVRNARPSRSVEALSTRAYSLIQSPKHSSKPSPKVPNPSKEVTPAKVYEACDVVTHKKHALRVRYRVANEKEPLPNIVEI